MSNWITTNLDQRTKDNLCDLDINFNLQPFIKDTFANNSARVAKSIYERFDNLYLTYSGGIDSEYVLKVFKTLNLHITPIIMVTPYNQEESEYAFKFCKDNSITPEVVTYEKYDILEKLYNKTCKTGLFSMLGGLPLVACDLVNQVGGKLLTGYGEPFLTPTRTDSEILSTNLEICEWDYYLNVYDNSHPAGFFSYDIGLFYSLVNEISYKTTTQKAKYELYELAPRNKMPWDPEFYAIFSQLCPKGFLHDYRIEKDVLLNKLLP